MLWNLAYDQGWGDGVWVLVVAVVWVNDEIGADLVRFRFYRSMVV